MITYVKYQKTLHLPWSEGRTDDDKVHSCLDQFVGLEVVVTEKMDGENATFYSDGSTHARSIQGRPHVSRDWMKTFAASKGYLLPGKDIRVCGENLYARHSIEYKELESYFLAFSVWEGSTCLDWDTTTDICRELEISMVPVLYRGIWNEELVADLARGCEENKNTTEGYVVRPAKSFAFEDFGTLVGKYVRKNHVTTTDHWMNQEVVCNCLADES